MDILKDHKWHADDIESAEIENGILTFDFGVTCPDSYVEFNRADVEAMAEAFGIMLLKNLRACACNSAPCTCGD